MIKFNESGHPARQADDESVYLANAAQALVDDGTYKTFGEALTHARRVHRIIMAAADAAVGKALPLPLGGLSGATLNNQEVALLLRICAGALPYSWKDKVGPSILHYAAVLVGGNQAAVSIPPAEPIVLKADSTLKLSDFLGSLGR